MFKHILCPIDGSQAAQQALDIAARLAQDQRAALTICTVVDPSQAAAMAFGDPGMSAACYSALEDEAKTLIAEATARLGDCITATAVTLIGQPVPGIVSHAAACGADLVVIGSHGRSGIPRAFLGSVAEGVLRRATIPVMIIRYTPHVKSGAAERVATEPATA